MEDIAARQRQHYDIIGRGYEAHYADLWSRRYRDRFISQPLTRGVELRNRTVLDAMCGSGELVQYLVGEGANVTGLDVSPTVVQLMHKKVPAARAVAGSIFDSGLDDESFDVVTVVGGLHHVQPRAQDAIVEIHRILRPGGWFVFAEPHAGSVFDLLRKAWYRVDPFFEPNEKAVDVQRLMADNVDRFEFVRTRYGGNLGYLLVFNSMVFRVPHWLKRAYAPALLVIEGLIEPIQGRRTSCMVRSQWRKRAPTGRPKTSNAG